MIVNRLDVIKNVYICRPNTLNENIKVPLGRDFKTIEGKIINSFVLPILYDVVFSFNDENTRVGVVTRIKDCLNLLKENDILYDYQVVCDQTNNTPLIIDENKFITEVIWKTKHNKIYHLKYQVSYEGIECLPTELDI